MKVGNVVRKWFGLFVLLFFVIQSSGCAGLMVRSMAKSGSKQKFSEVRESLSIPEEGYGRIFIYMTMGGSNAWNTAGVIDYCTVDEKAYEFIGKSFFYADIPAGNHKITATDIGNFWNGKPSYYGKEQLDVELGDQEEVYVKIDMSSALTTRWTKLIPMQMDKATAEQEMLNLLYYVKHKTKFTVKDRKE